MYTHTHICIYNYNKNILISLNNNQSSNNESRKLSRRSPRLLARPSSDCMRRRRHVTTLQDFIAPGGKFGTPLHGRRSPAAPSPARSCGENDFPPLFLICEPSNYPGTTCDLSCQSDGAEAAKCPSLFPLCEIG